VTHSSETSVLTRPTRLHIPEDGILHSHRCENLKWCRYLLLPDSCWFVDVKNHSWFEYGSVVYNCYWSSPAQSSWVWVPWDLWPYFTVSFSRLPQLGGPGPHIYLQEQCDPIIPPDIWFPFHCPTTRRAIQFNSIYLTFHRSTVHVRFRTCQYAGKPIMQKHTTTVRTKFIKTCWIKGWPQ
jgi:hypothetical protein